MDSILFLLQYISNEILVLFYITQIEKNNLSSRISFKSFLQKKSHQKHKEEVKTREDLVSYGSRVMR